MDFSKLGSALTGGRDIPWLADTIGVLAIFAAAWLALILTRRVLLRIVRRVAQQSATTWDDVLVESRVFFRLAHIAPALVIYYGLELVPGLDETLRVLCQRTAIAVMVVMLALSVGGLATAANAIWSSNPENRHRPIKGYLQIARLAVYLIAGLLVLSVLLDKSPWIFLSGVGALAAVLLLIFRDTILGLVASVQLTGNDMIHVGDWIEMPQFGADGDVIDVALHTVKVQNWDKTITTIPTYRLIQDSFKNWRGMSQSGGRRIKRSIYIDLGSVRFLSDEEVERAGRIVVLQEYIRKKRAEIDEHNAGRGVPPDAVPDQRRLTNVGTLRAYILHHLRNHPRIHQGMTLLVRQLQAGAQGLPLEIYAFTSTTEWAAYEDIQADLFDHIFAVLPEFGLRAFQSPSGHDLREVGRVS